MEAIIMSDLHLGSHICQAKPLCEFLEKIKENVIVTGKLILNGDVFDSWDFRRLQKKHWHALSLLRKLSDHIEIKWINGNHDGPSEIISHLLGIDVVSEYAFHSGEKRILCLHGDQFDDFITDHPIITYFADKVYNFLQWIDPSFYMARRAKMASKSYLRCSEQVEELAKEYAAKHECDIVCCGHTHLPVCKRNYFNSGSWTEKPCTWLSVNDGIVSLHEFWDS